ncbi:MAG: trifunctional transcriptional regulator/proline dehydrogenase/L-glutamate gamma-semialdehyde dehydrogenase, partial [Alphaproteobacteria bacterium]|nr:trifunctional transcriptional regulator/proline dehydrogenase/L-glutamate gamma-semialdehyde dehydrogenase [Alphaproteobacteria bacterium]
MKMQTHIMPDSEWAAGLFPTLGEPESEAKLVNHFLAHPALTPQQRSAALEKAREVAVVARQTSKLFSAEKIMTVYKLSTAEGRMIMELAEALLRVPDKTTRDFLIFDKLSPGHWLSGNSKGFLKGMTSALALASGIVKAKQKDGLQAAVSRLGVPTVRRAIETAMRQMGEDCDRYYASYEHAIDMVGEIAAHEDVNKNSGVSIKLSALSCRFQSRYFPSSHDDLTQRVMALALKARHYNIPITIDAEEYGRLRASLHVFQSLLAHPELQGWQGLGMVVQAYSRYAGAVINWLEDQAKTYHNRISIRLVKGAYWDTEIKIAQEKGLTDFPVYTDKNHTDLAYLAHARRLMMASAYFHPQFASHNAYTLSAVESLATEIKPQSYELQKLHGMGEAVHDEIRKTTSAPLRIYAPVGQHQDLLAYLVRRILENGASSSFMNQLADNHIPITQLITDPYD